MVNRAKYVGRTYNFNKGLKGNASGKHRIHTAQYWEKLKQEFETCTYRDSGAYSSIEAIDPKRLKVKQ